MKIALLGTGSWGLTLTWLLANSAEHISLWGRNKEVIEHLRKNYSIEYPFSIQLPKNIDIEQDMSRAVEKANIIILVVPTHAIREVSVQLRNININPSSIIVNTAKGLEFPSLKRMSQIIHEELPMNPVAVLSGPTLAQEILRGDPTAASIACDDLFIANELQTILSVKNKFRLYSNSDVIGVELGGALKNVIAIAIGIISKLGYGHNSKAALLTRGVVELSKIYGAFGGKLTTLYGLSGIGDLIATSFSPLSRNFQVGYKLAEGKALETVLQEIGTVAEGVRTTKALCKIEEDLKIDLPIAKELQKAFDGKVTPDEMVSNLMSRELKTEETSFDAKMLN